jgi:hypothetical protein
MLLQYLFIHAYPVPLPLNISLLRVVRPVRPDGRCQLLHLRKQGGTCLVQLDCNCMILMRIYKLKGTVQRQRDGSGQE